MTKQFESEYWADAADGQGYFFGFRWIPFEGMEFRFVDETCVLDANELATLARMFSAAAKAAELGGK